MRKRGLGLSFGENILGSSKAPKRPLKLKQPRWIILLIILVISSLVSLARLADLQVIRGGYFRELAEGNRIRRIPIKAPRGEIIDRTGKVIARNVPIYKLAKFSSGGVVVETIQISREEALKLQSNSTEASKIIIDIDREYALGPATSHVLGYVNEVSGEEVGRIPECNGENNSSIYQLGDLIGRMGIEAQFNCLLRGVNGEELIEVDTIGRLVRKLGRREPVPGKTIQLSIDADLQQVAYGSLLKERDKDGDGKIEGGVIKGAVVVQSPEDGEVLALVSTPAFDPKLLKEEYAKLANDENKPFFNRVLGGAYHPGSTFKLVSSAAALEDDKIDANYTYDDQGYIQIGTFVYRNWFYTQYGKTEGEVDVIKALTRSTDTFFYKIGELVGPERLAWWADKFGLGKKTGIDLPGEASGLVPDPLWKERLKGERWFLGNTYHMSIGQGDLTATPLQVNVMTAVIANGGKLCRPSLLNQETGIGNYECMEVGLKQENLDLIKKGMIGACSQEGTAFPFFNFSPQVACKTGTAETNKSGVTHAWLTAFAPAASGSAQVKPELVATSLVEEGGEGSRVAAPIIKEILDYWFHNR